MINRCGMTEDILGIPDPKGGPCVKLLEVSGGVGVFDIWSLYLSIRYGQIVSNTFTSIILSFLEIFTRKSKRKDVRGAFARQALGSHELLCRLIP